LKRGLVLFALLALAAPAPASARGSQVELVVTLDGPGLAAAAKGDRALAALTQTDRRLSLASPVSVSYLQRLAARQAAVAKRIVRAIPGARVRWRYRVTFNGLAVVVPTGVAAELARVPGVARVWPAARYRSSLDRTPQLIGAPALWDSPAATAGQGMKIAVVDEGVDQTHAFFNPSGFTMPAGYPKGNTSFTTAKVIAARAFAPASPTWRYANLPFDPQHSEHGTHVAGIAAGNRNTRATGFPGAPLVSGIAPAAYIGNYKALTIPTPNFGLDGNAPEIAAAIEAAVQDDMDVINLSIGEPEIPLARDIVVRALEGAAAAGVVPVTAAGNDFDDFGRGSVSSPASTPAAITVAASTTGRGAVPDLIAGFSSSGPTPISNQMKPDVTAPGVTVLSSVPAREGTWDTFSGTSMATPHVAGAAALLRQRHPAWTVAQVKSALEQTGARVLGSGAAGGAEVAPTREGGGRIDLVKADTPLVFAAPSGVSFGMLQANSSADRSVTLTDAGGGAATWTVSLPGATQVTAPATVSVPGTLALRATVAAAAAEGEASGFVVLTRGSDVRRIPWWLGVSRPSLGAPVRTLTKAGTYKGNASRGRASVSEYRYPEPDLPALSGPEQVFRVRITGNVANFGARVVSQAGGGTVEPRIVYGSDENRLAGYTALPLDLNPYRDLYGRVIPVAAAILPVAGTYSLVFDTRSRGTAGSYTFRFWINDTTPPRIRYRSYARGFVTVAVTDTGAGVDPNTLEASVDGEVADHTFRNGVLRLNTGRLGRGTHRLVVEAGDFQETKNMEDVARILPNTRIFRTTFRVR
jgi:subtilisin family serine protease